MFDLRCLGNVCEDMAFALCSWRWVFQPLHSGGRNWGVDLMGLCFCTFKKYSNVLMMLYLFHLVSRCWFQRFFYLRKTMSSPRFFKLKSLFGWMEWKRLRCMKKGVSVWAPRCRYLKVRASLTSRQGLQICFAVVWRELTGCWKHPQGSIALWCVHANVEVLQAFKQVVQYCQAKGNLQNGKPALKVAFR